jgi:trk system potassium uptake protein TrkH
MATGGFAPLNASVAGYPSLYIQYVIVIFMFIAATNFSLHFWALKGNPIRYFRNTEFLFFVCVIICAFISIASIRLLYGSIFSEELLRSSIFQTVSIISTTGFVTQDYELWPFATQFILLLLMFFGGCAGSTGGGIKSIRVYVLFKYLASEIKRLFYPRGVFPIKIQKTMIPENTVTNIIAFIVLYLLIFASGVFALTILGENIDTAIGAVASTLGNVGPGLGNVGPVENYSGISVTGKWILSFLMMTGRLEIYTVIVLFMPDFWR